eukprot:TRINITY_DN6871_c0_g1_i1.p1 TRINITY_DN6871_c0_g1~~TRINITY_DN6871_c0_g1_i1.p1  ORF type:complete len:1117 (+),score=136.46 TRINITY_DN6871_c0_g1_i1:101-3451(+)
MPQRWATKRRLLHTHIGPPRQAAFHFALCVVVVTVILGGSRDRVVATKTISLLRFPGTQQNTTHTPHNTHIPHQQRHQEKSFSSSSASSSTQQDQPPTPCSTPINDENEFIVVFKRYMPQTEHGEIIAKILGGEGPAWKLVERNNPSRFLPSDFALVKVVSNLCSDFVRFLSHNREVKTVLPQRKWPNMLKAIDDMEPEMTAMHQEHMPYRDDSDEDFGKGRKHTDFLFRDNDDWVQQNHTRSRKLHSSLIQVTQLLNAEELWDKSITGEGVKVAIFDTGLRADHPHFRNIRERTDWTDENTLEDGLGHGTFVAGVIASQTECLGFAPDVDLHIFRVFTKDRLSYTSWFLDAFNYAIHTKVNILNLSIGGPDFMDTPFIEKVWEMSANNIIVISAIGNDGPLYGTLNNPADQPDVIGVGGINYHERVASFSSRGMTTWELPSGYGRVKPDIVAYGKAVSGSRIYGGCRLLSGTSVASPVVAGAVALLASSLPARSRWETLNPASMKQTLISSAQVLAQDNIFEQGFGKLDLLASYDFLQNYVPHASVVPASLDLTDCPYMWPYCTQPIYYTGIPITFNATILNGMGVLGELKSEPVFEPGPNGHFLEISFSHCKRIWPWTGWISIGMRVSSAGANYDGEVDGVVRFSVLSAPGSGESVPRVTDIEMPLRVRIIPTPPRERRILFDQFHSLRYPSGYFPRDALWVKNEPFDWNGDHVHTNFKDMYTYLREWGYFVEVLGEPFLCFNASHYSTLLLIDSEEEFFPEEIAKLKKDVEEEGLSVAVFADWYNLDVMRKIKFFDENTRQWWTPATGGANIPALNDLLSPFGISFGDRIFDGEFKLFPSQEEKALFASGTAIASFPAGGRLIFMDLFDQTQEILESVPVKDHVPVLGLLSLRDAKGPSVGTTSTAGKSTNRAPGRMVVFGDSSCIDDAHQRSPCFWLLKSLLTYTSQGLIDDALFALPLPSLGASTGTSTASSPPRPPVSLLQLGQNTYRSTRLQQPVRIVNEENDLTKFSRVKGPQGFHPLPNCERSSFSPVTKATAPITLTWTRLNGQAGEATRPTIVDPNRIYLDPPGLIQDDGHNYLVPYLIVCGAVIGLVFMAVRGRKDRITKRLNL